MWRCRALRPKHTTAHSWQYCWARWWMAEVCEGTVVVLFVLRFRIGCH